MSNRDRLNGYIADVRSRLRMDAGTRGAAVVAGVALGATLLLTVILNAYAFPEQGLTPARIALLVVMAGAIGFGLGLPLARLSWRRAIRKAEQTFPEFQQRLTTFSEKENANSGEPDLFLELLAADTLGIAAQSKPSHLVPLRRLAWLLGIAAGCAAVLIWMIAARPGFVGYGASLLWTGPRKDVAPIYEIRVAPGDAAVRRNSDQMVTAQVIGLATGKVSLFARYASGTKWEPVAMQPQMDGSGFQFLFAGLPENVEYYVAAGPATSKHFHFRVVDLPAVKAMQVTYRYPKWTGLQTVSEDHAGDLRALEGTDADLTITMTSPLKDGVLVLDGGQPVKLVAGEGDAYHATIHMQKDGAYHVAGMDQGQQVRLSEDYFLSTSKANPPSVAIDRPAGDYRASPIEEVTVGVKAGAEFGLTHLSLHYSVNGGADQAVSLLKQPGAKDTSGSATLNLEDYKLSPGDVVSLYAIASDAHAESRTEIGFIQVDPFEREFSQSQQGGGGGGGGGGGQQGQTDIARREKELIEATWKQQNDKTATTEQAAAQAKLLAEAQRKLKEQALALSARMQSRDLAQANEEFNSFDKDMETAAAGMGPSADKLSAMQWADALPVEQKVLQALLRAEATFRKIEVAFGQRSGGGGGGGGSAGRDLASLFDLEMDTQKNQYETAQTGSAAEQQAKKVDDALAKLDALAKRQEELAQKQSNQAQTFQERWQQEMLRREAEQLQRDMEKMQGQQSAQNGQQSQQGQSGASSGQGQSQSAGAQGARSQSAAGSSAGTMDGAADPRVTQALERLRAANESMANAGGRQGAQGAEEAKRAADRLREATQLLGGAQRQQATGRLDGLGQEADRLAKEEAAQAERIRKLAAAGEAMAAKNASGTLPTSSEMAAAAKERDSLANDRQKMSDDLEKLQRGLRGTAKDLAATQPGAAGGIRDALGGMDRQDLTNLVQRTADWLRRGVNPNSNGTEGTIASGLKRLDDQVRQAAQAAGASGAAGDRQGRQPAPGTQTAALDHVDRLRSEIERLAGGAAGQGGKAGQEPQAGPSGQAGQNGRAGQGSQTGREGVPAQGGSNGRGGRQAGAMTTGELRGGGGADANLNVDTGGQRYGSARSSATPQPAANPADLQRFVEQGMGELSQLRQLAKGDPAAEREIADLAREMQKLDPARFPGNPAMVEELHARVLGEVDKLELQLRSASNQPQPGQVRTAQAPVVPADYRDAVADYYRRLGRSQ